jgi:hypothetical protein
MPGVGNTAPLHYRNDTIAVVTSLDLGFAYPQCYLFCQSLFGLISVTLAVLLPYEKSSFEFRLMAVSLVRSVLDSQADSLRSMDIPIPGPRYSPKSSSYSSHVTLIIHQSSELIFRLWGNTSHLNQHCPPWQARQAKL